MNDGDLEFLMLIPATEPFTFGEMCNALAGDCPHDTAGWRDLFARIKRLETDGFVEVERAGSKLEAIQLSPQGAALIRDRLDATRGLLSLEGI